MNKKFNKKKLMLFGALGLFVLALVSAAVMPYLFNRQTTIDAEQTLEGLGINIETVPCSAGNICLGDSIEVSSIANRDRVIQVTTTEEEGIGVSYVGILELTKKDTTTWQPTEDKLELTYTVVGEEFEFSGVPDGYTLIYYKDEVVGLEGRLANPQPAIIVTSDIGSFPHSDDANIDELANYCATPDFYEHCKGAKLWVVPTSDIVDNNLNWANMANYYYETDLVYYFANADGELIIPTGSFIEFYPQYTLSPMIVGDTYSLTTEVIALN